MASTKAQVVTTWRAGGVERLELPAACVEVVPGVRWGRFEEFFTPAFWVARSWIDGSDGGYNDYSLGRSIREEVAACLLGGHGMPAEVGVAAFQRLRDWGMLDGRSPEEDIENALREPLCIEGRSVRYRFPRTKGRFVAKAMHRLNVEEAPGRSGVAVRNWLMSFDGIGPKTASWITRNALHSDDVAILDIHIVRAGLLMGLFSAKHSVARNYFEMEASLVGFAKRIELRLSRLDSMIWCYMRRLNDMAIDALAATNLDLRGV